MNKWVERLVIAILFPILVCGAICLGIAALMIAILTLVGEWLSSKRESNDNKGISPVFAVPVEMDSVHQLGHNDLDL